MQASASSYMDGLYRDNQLILEKASENVKYAVIALGNGGRGVDRRDPRCTLDLRCEHAPSPNRLLRAQCRRPLHRT